MEEEADEAKEHEESPSRSNEDGGNAIEGSDSEVDSLAQLRRTESGRGSRIAVHRGVPVVEKGKGTMAKCGEVFREDRACVLPNWYDGVCQHQ